MFRHRWLGALIPLAALAAAGSLLSGCSGGRSGPQPVTLTLYNGQHEQTTAALVSRFEAQTGIRVKERDGDEDQLAEEIEQQGGSTPADVFLSENSPSLMSLQGKGLLASLPPNILSQVPSRYNSPKGDWIGVSARVSVMVYNTSQLKASQLPRSILDLAGPQWKGKLAVAPTETDLLPVVSSIARARGSNAAVTWLKAIKNNAASHIEPDNETVTSDVNSGQAAIGVVDHYYWYRMAREVGPSHVRSAIGYFQPGDPGYVLDVSGAGVIKSSGHLAAAEEFVGFLVSQTGQQTMVGSDSFEYPLRPGVAPPKGVTPLADLHPNPVSIAELGDGSEAFQLEQEAQII